METHQARVENKKQKEELRYGTELKRKTDFIKRPKLARKHFSWSKVLN